MQESLSVISERNVWSHCSHYLVQSISGLQAASAYVTAVIWSVAGAAWHFTQAAGLLAQHLWHLASHFSMRAAAAAAALLGSAGRILNRITVLIAQCGYALGLASALLAVIAAELAVLSFAAAILALMMALMMAMPFQIARLVRRTIHRLSQSLRTIDSREAAFFWLSDCLDWCKHKLAWLARPDFTLPRQALTQLTILPYRPFASMVKPMTEAPLTVEHDQCTICWETVPKQQMVCVEPCSHSYCKTCVATHLQTRLENNRNDMLRCPALGCTAAQLTSICCNVTQL